jgi:hypothetical protein
LSYIAKKQAYSTLAAVGRNFTTVPAKNKQKLDVSKPLQNVEFLLIFQITLLTPANTTEGL